MSIKSIIKSIIKKIPPLEKWRQLRRHTFVNTKKLSGEIDNFFNDISSSKNSFFKKKRIDNLIISFTTFPARIMYVEYTLSSLIRQTIRPKKIILWLSEKEFPGKENDIPKILKRYFQFDFEIQFVKENFKSFNKLVFCLEKYPHYTIVTADDDYFYKENWLESLYKTHKVFPRDIVSNRVDYITFRDRHIGSCNDWNPSLHEVSYFNFLQGYAGTLYPPHLLYKDAVNHNLFMKLTPSADDIWFYMMAFLQQTKIRSRKGGEKTYLRFDYIFSGKYKKVPRLTEINIDQNKNDLQFKAVLTHYGIYDSFYDTYLRSVESGDAHD